MMSFAGYRVVADINWPRLPDGIETVRDYNVHPLVKWLARWLPIKPYVEALRPRFRDRDPMIDERHGIIYRSPRQCGELAEATKNAQAMLRAAPR